MSRTYRKYVRLYICTGDNRDFYKRRRRKRRNKINQEDRNIKANFGAEAIDEMWKGPCMPTEDQWIEPTDGHWAESKASLKRMDRILGRNNWYHEKYDRYLKDKKKKYIRVK